MVCSMSEVIYGGIRYTELAKLFRKYRYIPMNSNVSITFSNGTPENTEGFIEVTPPSGYRFAITYFTLTTPEEVQANILGTSIDGTQKLLLATNQAENLSDQNYPASDWDQGFLVLNSFQLYGIVTAAATTADRTVTLYYGGGYVEVL